MAEGHLRCFVANTQLFADLIVEVLQQLAPRCGHGFADLKTQLQLKLVESNADFLALSTALVDVIDASFKIHAGFDSPEHLVTRAKDTLEKLELFREQFEDALVGFILPV